MIFVKNKCTTKCAADRGNCLYGKTSKWFLFSMVFVEMVLVFVDMVLVFVDMVLVLFIMVLVFVDMVFNNLFQPYLK